MVSPVSEMSVNVGRLVSWNVKLSAFDAAWPEFVSVTLTVPGACAGVVTPTDVLPQLLTAAFVPPNETDGNAGVHWMFEPLIVTAVPPLLVPLVGVSEVRTAAPPVPTPPRFA